MCGASHDWSIGPARRERFAYQPSRPTLTLQNQEVAGTAGTALPPPGLVTAVFLELESGKAPRLVQGKIININDT